MTRPKADSDPWLTDMVSRDREIAKTVVYGIREMLGLLRTIRDLTEARLVAEQQHHTEVMQALASRQSAPAAPVRDLRRDFPACENEGCSLPRGHLEAHRGKLSRAG